MSTSISEVNSITAYRAGSLASASSLYRIRGATPSPAFVAVSASGTVVWNDGGAGGSFILSGVGNSIASYSPANKTQAVVITAIDAANTVTRSLTVYGTLPVYPQIGYEMELDVDTKVKMARDRTRYFREDGALEAGWTFAWSEREKDQYLELMRFWRDHRKTKQFYLVDTEGDLLNLVWFNSSFKAIPSGANRWALSAAFRGVFQDVVASSIKPIHLRINAGGPEVSPYQADAFSYNGTSFDLGAITPNTANITDPAPDAVYRTIKFDTDWVGYQITGLKTLAPYQVRLHFCLDATRVLTPIINGVTYSPIVVGGAYVVDKRAYDVTSNGSGIIYIQIFKVSGVNAFVNAVEIVE